MSSNNLSYGLLLLGLLLLTGCQQVEQPKVRLEIVDGKTPACKDPVSGYLTPKDNYMGSGSIMWCIIGEPCRKLDCAGDYRMKTQTLWMPVTEFQFRYEHDQQFRDSILSYEFQ